jgi:PAS domain S-box-containing protein
MDFMYNPYSLPLTINGVEAIALAVIVYRRSWGKRGVIPFIWLMIMLAIWSLAYALELSVLDLPTKNILVKFEFIGIIFTPVAAFLFGADYTGVDRWLTRRSLIMVCSLPVATFLLVLTNELHYLFYSSVRLDTSGPFPNFVGAYGLWFWIHSGYSYLLMLFALGMLVRAMIRAPRLYRSQANSMLIGMLAPWVGNAIYLAGLSPFPNLDITPFFFAFTGLALAWSLVRFKLFEIVPAARDMVIENLRDAVIVLDDEGRVVDLNPSARGIIGETAEDAIGKLLSEVIPNQRELIERFRGIDEVRTEIEFTTDGIPRQFDLRVSSLRERGGVRGRLIVVHEITDRKIVEKKLSEARDQALEASRTKSRILAVVSHDFRTPLGAILGYADMLKEGTFGPLVDEQKKLVERIIVNVSQLNNLVNDLLDQSQIEAGKVTMHMVPFSPEQLANNVEGALNKRAADKGLKLVTSVEDGTPDPIVGDLSRVLQVVTNLADNAIKFTTDGEVKVRISRIDSTHWGVDVSDTGPGISEEEHSHIFEPFWQAEDYQVRREGRGVGLGLSIARQLVLRMDGKINVESKPGKGTIFKVVLPISPRSIKN